MNILVFFHLLYFIFTLRFDICLLLIFHICRNMLIFAFSSCLQNRPTGRSGLRNNDKLDDDDDDNEKQEKFLKETIIQKYPPVHNAGEI